ncbi:hypothetical protein O1611_g10143 [Lasiodiplodia mahajangana]|uniref:Uncharacterized protein n=1 Tax=Lasiodiplodia mahajangana TaxID=1108764 RepID=A0ACC2J1I1_9PEZI|nr:hypothetical protein O1611_g10143 [Lasiodiplodia mahajangana]
MFIYDGSPTVMEALPVLPDFPVQYGEGQETTSSKWKGKGKAVMPESEEVAADSEVFLDPEMVDWTRYEPPEGLRHSGDIESEMVTQVIRDSIDRVKDRIFEEAEKKAAAEAKQKREGKEKEGGDEGGPVGKQNEQANGSKENGSLLFEGSVQPDVPDQPPEKSGKGKGFPGSQLMNVFRKLNGNPENGESSSAGAAHQKMLMQSSQAKLTTHAERKSYVLGLISGSTSRASSVQACEV